MILAEWMGEATAKVVTETLREELMRRVVRGTKVFSEELLVISHRCAALPDLDTRSSERMIDSSAIAAKGLGEAQLSNGAVFRRPMAIPISIGENWDGWCFG